MSPTHRARRLLRRTAAAAALATTLPAADARAEFLFGGFAGMTFWPEVRFVYGVDVRSTFWYSAPGSTPPTLGAFARVEGHGLSYARLAAGLTSTAVKFDSGLALSGDIGLEVSTSALEGWKRAALGLHLGAAAGVEPLGLMLNGTLPVFGDPAAGFVGTHLRFSPEILKPAPQIVDGRALRDDGGIVLPDPVGTIGTEDDVVSGWLEAARAEAASVPAFERLAIELRIAGAPESLARDAEASAADEVRHANAALAEAARRAGRPIAVPYPETRARFAQPSPEALRLLAVEAYVDGCIGEGAAAYRAAHSRANDAVTARHLQTIAREEAEHAALAWRILEWAVAVGGDDVRDAVHEAAKATRDQHSARDTDSFATRHGLTPPDVAAQAFLLTERDARRRLQLA